MSEISLHNFYTPIATNNYCCSKCGQKLPKENKLGLSKNLIYFLVRFQDFVNEHGYVETKELYDLNHKGSTTAFLTQLKYFGAIQPHFTAEDEEKLSKRSGKWKITHIGASFLEGYGRLAKYVKISNSRVIEYGDFITIDDPYLKWNTEDDIWEMLKRGGSK